MGLKSFPDEVTTMLRKNLGGKHVFWPEYESGKRKVRHIVSTKKYSIMAKPANKQHSLLYKYL